MPVSRYFFGSVLSTGTAVLLKCNVATFVYAWWWLDLFRGTLNAKNTHKLRSQYYMDKMCSGETAKWWLIKLFSCSSDVLFTNRINNRKHYDDTTLFVVTKKNWNNWNGSTTLIHWQLRCPFHSTEAPIRTNFCNAMWQKHNHWKIKPQHRSPLDSVDSIYKYPS